MKKKRFIGLALGGGKTDKTFVAAVEFFPDQQKIFLSQLYEKIQTSGEVSSDQHLYELLSKTENRAELLAINAPLKLPKCMRCRLSCPGFERCKEPEIVWMWRTYRARNDRKRPGKLFTPYTERCAEVHIANAFEEPFAPSHALGANMAPLTARALFLSRRLKKVNAIEVYPRLSLWRIGRSLGIQKSYLRSHKHAVGGEEARRGILNELVSRKIAFLYDQDFKSMIGSGEAFDAFLCALTAVLKWRGQVESRPKGFPRTEAWIEVPRLEIDW